jgi:YidC/Oxa1 family membrane protein insertase
MFEGFFDLVGSILNFFYTLIPNYGISIILLTILVMVLITPLTVKSTKSMLQMQRLQPEMKRIQAKYKNDREKQNEEMMKFYKENSINPLGGCLPLLAQMPVFIIMYQLLQGLTNRVGGSGSGVGQLAGEFQQGLELTPWIYEQQNFRPLHLNPDTKLYQSLSDTNTMQFLGMDLALSPSQALRIGLLTALPFFLLLAIMLGTGLYQNRQLRSRNKDAAVNPQQQMIMKVMPFFLPVFSFGFPAGLSVYWCTQNFCRIGTNAYITRSIYAKQDKATPPGGSAEQRNVKKGASVDGDGDESTAPVPKNGAAKNGAAKNGSTSAGTPKQKKGGSGKASSANKGNGTNKKKSSTGRKSGAGSSRRSGDPRPSGSADGELR